jgi:death-on-curing protein
VTEFLDLEDLVTLVRVLKAGPIRDPGLLDSAAARPRSTVFGEPAYSSLSTQAAALLHSIACNHALVDGNKRLAWLACVVFLDVNDADVAVSDEEAFQLVMDVASGQCREVEAIAERLRVHER